MRYDGSNIKFDSKICLIIEIEIHDMIVLHYIALVASYVRVCHTGWAEANFLWGATVNSEKIFFKNSQNLLNKSQKVGGAIAPPAPLPARALKYSSTYVHKYIW